MQHAKFTWLLKNAYKSSARKSEGKRPLVNWYEFVDWIQLAQERTQWWALVNVSKELWGFIEYGRSSRLAEQKILNKFFALQS